MCHLMGKAGELHLICYCCNIKFSLRQFNIVRSLLYWFHLAWSKLLATLL